MDGKTGHLIDHFGILAVVMTTLQAGSTKDPQGGHPGQNFRKSRGQNFRKSHSALSTRSWLLARPVFVAAFGLELGSTSAAPVSASLPPPPRRSG
jgi:hypothetical protein